MTTLPASRLFSRVVETGSLALLSKAARMVNTRVLILAHSAFHIPEPAAHGGTQADAVREGVSGAGEEEGSGVGAAGAVLPHSLDR